MMFPSPNGRWLGLPPVASSSLSYVVLFISRIADKFILWINLGDLRFKWSSVPRSWVLRQIFSTGDPS